MLYLESEVPLISTHLTGVQPSGGIVGIIHPENFKTLHSNFDICRNFQRINMKCYILIMKILYSNSENWVCTLLFFVS